MRSLRERIFCCRTCKKVPAPSEFERKIKQTTAMNLTSDIRFIKGVGETLAKRLNKLNIFSAYDLLMHIPRGYDDQSTVTPIASLKVNDKATVLATITTLRWIMLSLR